ncbi:MAG: hypothetical protein RL141_919 [Candidatus Parcubacteria bacterium]|jgi:predicted dehydrogenase
MMPSSLSLVIVGCGSIGTRHLENLRAEGWLSVAVIEPDEARAQVVRDRYGVAVFASTDAWATRGGTCDAALICSASAAHAKQAQWFAERGAHLFIEKPVAISLAEARALEQAVQEKELVTMVGYNMRFYPLFIRLRELLDQGAIGTPRVIRGSFGYYLPSWRPQTDYRTTYSAQKAQGGGILLDSHEVDYLSWFGGEITAVSCTAARVSDLEIDTEDTADVSMTFASGAVGSLHLDYLRKRYDRWFEVVGSSGVLRWQDTEAYRGTLTLQQDGKPDTIFEEPEGYARGDTYRDEMREFLACVAERRQTACPVSTAVRDLAVILAARQSSEEGCVKTL